MDSNQLKSYDIASFDIELEYNKQITPITKKIERLNSSHETKSLKAHKDFLMKEKKSKEKLTQLNDKAVIKEQRIEKATQNKITKLRAKERRIHKEYDDFVTEKNKNATLEYEKINEYTNELKKEEQLHIKEIKDKYKTNIESYVEKLNIYNDNFENNKQYHIEEISKHQDKIDSQIIELKKYNDTITEKLRTKLDLFTELKEQQDEDIKNNTLSSSRMLSNHATNIRKRANINIQEIHEYIEQLKAEYQSHFEPEIDQLKQEIINYKESFEKRRKLIEEDLELNIEKLESQLEDIKDSKNRKATKNINMKINLFKTRATTVIKYEERILNEKVLVLEKELDILIERLSFEMLNLEKLNVFLLSDQNELKATGDYYRDLNKVLKTELNNFELSNNNYELKHEQLKTDFINNYTRIFSDLKESQIALAQAYLEKIADNNFEIDEINKFLDTAEPLKEIEVNRLREDIEISEVVERYKIKYAKQDYETKLIKNELDTECKIRELDMKEELIEVKRDEQLISIKETYDKSLEQAKLKHSKAQEVYNLRLNNTKLERNLLTNKYETEVSISVHQKELIEIDVRKHNALISKEIEYAIANHETEAKYKIEVVNKGLEEDLLRLNEEVSKVQYEKDAYSANLSNEIKLFENDIQTKKYDIEQKSSEKINLIEQALAREIKEPSRNILKTETIIDERLSKLDINNGFFIDFINDSIEDYKDNNLTIEQIREVILMNNTIFDKASKYINRTYEVYIEATQFMNDIEKHALLNKIAATQDQSTVKKYQKQLSKLENDYLKQSQEIGQARGDHQSYIKNVITESLKEFKRANFDDLEQLTSTTYLMYNRIFDKVKNIQENIKQGATDLYGALTKTDNELITHAKNNATKAKALVEEEKQKAFQPLDAQLEQFLTQKEDERAAFYQTHDERLAELKAQINHHKNEALEKVKTITHEKDTMIQAKLEQKQRIEETEDKEITRGFEEVGNQLRTLHENYEATLLKLEEKDTEAKKIFDYEDRIYNIAVESATSRYNDGKTKIENRYLNDIQRYQNQKETLKKDKEKNINTFNNELINLTNRFEKNIFTVRPRLEESIGDAQKAIDKEIYEKKLRLSELTENNQKLILTIENALYTAFQEGYDRLSNNLANYIEKYRIIENEFIEESNQSNNILSQNNNTFVHALFELAKNKHQSTQDKLININKEISSKEDNNG